MYYYFIYDIFTGELFDCGIAETVEEIWRSTENIISTNNDASIGVNLRYIGETND